MQSDADRITQLLPTVTDPTSGPAWRWTWREKGFAAALATFTVYCVVITCGLAYTSMDRILPPQANQIILTSLALAVFSCLSLSLYHRHRVHTDEQFAISRARADEQFTVMAAQMTKLAEAQPGYAPHRGIWEQPTVPDLNGNTRAPIGGVYTSIAAVHHSGVNVDVLLERLVKRVDERVDGRLDDLRRLAENGQSIAAGGVGQWPEGVTPFSQRRH
jgi:hypothetical protein